MERPKHVAGKLINERKVSKCCVCVCVYVCVCECMCVYVYMCVCVCVYVLTATICQVATCLIYLTHTVVILGHENHLSTP
jgi:hypothetical protein